MKRPARRTTLDDLNPAPAAPEKRFTTLEEMNPEPEDAVSGPATPPDATALPISAGTPATCPFNPATLTPEETEQILREVQLRGHLAPETTFLPDGRTVAQARHDLARERREFLARLAADNHDASQE
ncbi:MAG: hypothetical protein U0Z53_29030 [Blastocatellia bacterium]